MYFPPQLHGAIRQGNGNGNGNGSKDIVTMIVRAEWIQKTKPSQLVEWSIEVYIRNRFANPPSCIRAPGNRLARACAVAAYILMEPVTL